MSTEKILNYTKKIDKNQLDKLYKILDQRGYSFSQMQYTHWVCTLPNLVISAYLSGKVVIQGKGTEDFILFTLEPEVLKKASLGYDNLTNKPKINENTLFSPHIGIDESGKGDFFGPLVISAVYVDNKTKEELLKIGVKDSKAIKNDKLISIIADKIKKIVEGKFSIVAIGPEAYNNLYSKINNLNRLLAWGHARSLENILSKDIDCDMAIADKFGNEKLIKNALMKNGKKIELIQRTKAESDVAVAAASIIARAEFVRRIKKLGDELGTVLPKGASSKVLDTSVQIIEKYGQDKLNSLAKLHFRTYQKAIDLYNKK
ncbi:MAG: ribonuclease HIII [bacterium]|nr:ribonuclease HIII [bacterium]